MYFRHEHNTIHDSSVTTLSSELEGVPRLLTGAISIKSTNQSVDNINTVGCHPVNTLVVVYISHGQRQHEQSQRPRDMRVIVVFTCLKMGHASWEHSFHFMYIIFSCQLKINEAFHCVT